MARFLMIVLAFYALLAGAFAYHGGPLLAPAAVPADSAATRRSALTPVPSRPRADIPRQPMKRPPYPIVSPTSDGFVLTIAARIVIRGETKWVVVRASEDVEDAAVLGTPDGRIPVFPGAWEARTWADGTLPAPTAMASEARAHAELARIIERSGTFDCDLDQAYSWAAVPRRDGLAPDSLLAAWKLLALASEVPPAPEADLMGTAGARGESGRRVLGDTEELELAMAKVGVIMHLARSEPGKSGAPVVVRWPAASRWSEVDAARVARAMRPAVAGFAARLTDDVGGVARTLRSASR